MLGSYIEEALDNTRVGVAFAHEVVVYARENKEDLENTRAGLALPKKLWFMHVKNVVLPRVRSEIG